MRWIVILSDKRLNREILQQDFFNSSDPLADIFTKSLRGLRIGYIYNKLGAYDLYAPACGGMLRISIDILHSL